MLMDDVWSVVMFWCLRGFLILIDDVWSARMF